MNAGALAALLLLVLLNAMFVAAEFAFVRARRERLEAVPQARWTKAALSALEKLETSLSVCQLGVSATSIGIGFVGGAWLAPTIQMQLNGSLSRTASQVVAVGGLYAQIVLVHSTLSGQIPKLFAMQRAELVVRVLSTPLLAAHKVLRPFLWLPRRAVRRSLVLLGAKPDAVHHYEDLPGAAELDALISRAKLAGRLEADEAGMLAGVLDLHERSAGHVMTPIFNVVSVTADASVRVALELCHESDHHRLLVLARERGPEVGVVDVGALSRELMRHGPEAAVRACMTDVRFVPETKPLDELMAELRHDHHMLTLVADEYGMTTGIVTVQDIIEEIVGERNDGVVERPERQRQADGSLLLPGHISLHDLADEGELPDWTGGHDLTIAGMVFALLGRKPNVGDVVQRDGYSLSVRAMDENRISEVVVIAPAPSSTV